MPDPSIRPALASAPAALDGLRVLDLTTLLAAPQIAAMLGDFGADVVKIEPPSGDPLRQIGVRRGEGSPAWAFVSRNKRAITLDLDRPEGQRLFRRLVGEADVLVENLTPALRERWGCDYASLSAAHPRLVVVSVSCHGQTGPRASEPGAGALAEAYAGFAHMNGEAGGPPILPSLPLGDAMTGFSGVIGALLACYWRDRRESGSGLGQHVDVSMYEPILQLLGLPFATWDGTGSGPRRNGSRVEGGVPRNLYRCRDDRWIALSGTTDAQVARVLETIGRSGPEDIERYGRSAARLRVADELDGLVADWIAERDRDEVLAAFRAAASRSGRSTICPKSPAIPMSVRARASRPSRTRPRHAPPRLADAEARRRSGPDHAPRPGAVGAYRRGPARLARALAGRDRARPRRAGDREDRA